MPLRKAKTKKTAAEAGADTPKKELGKHQDYDKIFKESISKAAPSLVKILCGIEAERWESVSRSVPRTIERRSDWLKIGTETASGERFLYHLEFQSANQSIMPYRMLVYYALFSEREGLPMRQFLIYLGEGNCTMPSSLKTDVLDFRYSVISINTIDYQVFVQSAAPKEIILAILGNFGGRENEAVVGEIVAALKDKTKNELKLQKLIFQLEILSHLRNLQPVVTTKLDSMAIHYDITTDVRYLQGEEVGVAIGKAEGKAESLALSSRIIKQHLKGKTATEITTILDCDISVVLTAIHAYDSED